MLPDGEDLNEWVTTYLQYLQCLYLNIYSLYDIPSMTGGWRTTWWTSSTRSRCWWERWPTAARTAPAPSCPPAPSTRWAEKVWKYFSIASKYFLPPVPLGRRQHGEDPYQVLCAALHRLPDDLDPGPGGGHISTFIYNIYTYLQYLCNVSTPGGGRGGVPQQDRRNLPQELPVHRQAHSQAALQSVRSCLPSTLQRGK